MAQPPPALSTDRDREPGGAARRDRGRRLRRCRRADRGAALGAGIPSQIEFATGTVLSSVNIPLEGVPLREELSNRAGVPAVVDNDANCAALAESDELPGSNIVMLTLGTGVGGGVVIDGRIFRSSGPRRRARPRGDRRERPSVPGLVPEPRLPRGFLLRDGARGAMPTRSQRTAPTPTSDASSPSTAR